MILQDFWEALLETGHITRDPVFLITAASIYSADAGAGGLPNQLRDMLAGNQAAFCTMMLLYVIC